MKSFFAANLPPLVPLDDKGDVWLGEVIEAARSHELQELADLLAGDSPLRSFLGSLCTLSPYLREILINQPHFLEILREHPLETALGNVIDKVAKLDLLPDLTETVLMRRLRCLKKHAALMIALGDLSQLFELATTTTYLSQLAESALGTVSRFLLRQAHERGQINLTHPQNPERDCGFVLLGLGKLGSHELNYSSDIDLIAFIDETAPAITNIQASVDVFSKLMRRLVRIMQERTEDGYVFRVDLRLRPDPASTPLALPFGAALNYYESRGQNWERAAFIKARPVAGDIQAGTNFLKELEPYIWRKYLDYAAIADIAAIKNQIHKSRTDIQCKSLEQLSRKVGTGFRTKTAENKRLEHLAKLSETKNALAGTNIKLGVGGIREIEFFVQTQQLIAGGRLPQLRGRSTVAMLAALCDLSWITPQPRDELSKNYVFLRRVEHCIQMVADEQSHTLPQDEEGFLAIARLMGYENATSFSTDLCQVMRQVEHHYSALFADIVPRETREEIFNFMAEEADPRTLDKMSELGFERVDDMYRIIHSWYSGRYRATHSPQARTRLQQLTPALLQAIAASGRADETLLQFDAFLRSLPAGVQLFSLLQSNKGLLAMLMLVMGSAPRLSDIITRRPHVFDGMLDPTLFNSLPSLEHLEQRLKLFLEPANNYEEKLDRLRIFRQEQHFLIGLRLLSGSIEGTRAGQAFSELADLMIAHALTLVRGEFSTRHGVIKGGKVAILGLGKLGSRELRAGSDVDLILLYEHDEMSEMSDGDKPLYSAQYYARLTQRLIAALVSPTAEGVLYQVDMRLRPSGNKGPVAVSFDSFSRYQRGEAWVWEHLALTRARVIAGDEDLCAKINADVAAILRQPRKREDLTREIATMRARIAHEKPAQNIWDLKHHEGGIIDLEFIAQYGVLSGHSERTLNPDTGLSVMKANENKKSPYQQAGQTSGEILASLPQNLCTADERQELCQAFTLYTNLNQIISLCVGSSQNLDDAPTGLVARILAMTDQPDLSHLKSLIQETSAHVKHIFDRLFL